MTQITYLLGAGASANVLPVVNNLRDRLSDLVQYLSNFSDKKLNPDAYLIKGFDKKYQQVYDSLITELKWLNDESEYHQTIDTLAKKFYNTDASSLLRLKRALISFFILEQLLNSNSGKLRFDKRYDSFIASILENEKGAVELNGNVKIVTWNYDVQFELAFKNYMIGSKSYFFNIQTNLQVTPSRRSISDINYIKELDINKFSIVKLNGQAFFDRVETDPHKDYRTIFDEVQESDKKNLDRFFSFYEELFDANWEKRDCLKLFNFAWEKGYFSNDEEVSLLEDYLIKIAKETEVLVVIGYSFPFFNRNVDRLLINNMCNLRKIYIQNTESEIDKLKSLMQSSFYIEFSPERGEDVLAYIGVTNVDSFFLPPDL